MLEFTRIHFITLDESAVYRLFIALKENNLQVTCSNGELSEQITSKIDAVVVAHVDSDNCELRKAKDLGLKIYSYSEFLYQIYKDKTRIVVAGSRGKTTIISMILHTLSFHDKSIDYVVGIQLDSSEIKLKLSKENDFAILEYNKYELFEKGYKPNIALISWVDQKDIVHLQEFVNSITYGGIIIYNQEDIEVVKIVENSNNYLRKIPYKTPDYEIFNNETTILTKIGKIPIQLSNVYNLQNIEASRNICQQLGIMEEEFYEAMMNFSL